ncbi:MAG: porin, partial [Flavobacterium sp.]
MKKLLHLLILLLPTLMIAQDLKLDTKSNELKLEQLPYYSYGKGLGMTSADSIFQLNIRFRMQNRLTFNNNEGEKSTYEGEIRRLRLRLDGFVGNPKFLYVIQLSFAPKDMGTTKDG